MTRAARGPHAIRRPAAAPRGRNQRAPGRLRPPIYSIQVARATQESYLTAARLKVMARAALAAESVTNATVSIAVVDNATIRRLNRRFLDHDYETDVLSFLFESSASGSASKTAARERGRGLSIDGEVVVSAEMAARCAERVGTSAADELALYLVHGLLHLCGYEDRSRQERLEMRRRERAILAPLGFRAAMESRSKGSR